MGHHTVALLAYFAILFLTGYMIGRMRHKGE